MFSSCGYWYCCDISGAFHAKIGADWVNILDTEYGKVRGCPVHTPYSLCDQYVLIKVPMLLIMLLLQYLYPIARLKNCMMQFPYMLLHLGKVIGLGPF